MRRGDIQLLDYQMFQKICIGARTSQMAPTAICVICPTFSSRLSLDMRDSTTLSPPCTTCKRASSGETLRVLTLYDLLWEISYHVGGIERCLSTTDNIPLHRIILPRPFDVCIILRRLLRCANRSMYNKQTVPPMPVYLFLGLLLSHEEEGVSGGLRGAFGLQKVLELPISLH